MSSNVNRLFLLDGMALVYRAYFALIRNPRITSTGLNTSAIFGYTNTLINILKTESPTHIAVAFDTPEPTQRHREYPEYKAQRESTPEDLLSSLPHIFDVTAAFNIPVLKYPGYEADDVIGTLVKKAEKKNFQTYMITPDKDFAQLVSDKCSMIKPGRFQEENQILGVPEILEKWGIQDVSQVVDILGLWGDASDNIPGVPGIGEKTAKSLVARFGSIEGVIQNSAELKGKQRENVEKFSDQALLSKRLVTIDCQVPMDIDITDLVAREQDDHSLRRLFAEFEFKTLGKRFFGATFSNDEYDLFNQEFSAANPESTADETSEGAPQQFRTIDDIKHDYQLVDTEEQQLKVIALLEKESEFCFDTETTGLDPKTAELVGIAFTIKAYSGYYVPFPNDPSVTASILERFRPLFENPNISKIGHNLKYDIAILHWHGVTVNGPLLDTMLAHYLIDPDARHKMDTIAESYLEYKPVPIDRLIGPKGKDQKNMRDIDVSQVVEYAVEDSDITIQLWERFKIILKEQGVADLYDKVESPLIAVLVAMEAAGVKIDKAALKEYSKSLDQQISKFRSKIYEFTGLDFNIDSPKQLGEVLFDHLQLNPKAKRTRTGQYSTSEQVLSKLAGRHEIVRDVLDYRSLRKLKNTYVDTLPESIFPRTGRVHTTYSQAVAATGRLQSQNPNLQNIPIRTAKGKEIRKSFIPAGPEYLILSADYSQIELRIIAELSGDEAMIDAFNREIDVHRATAAKIFGLELENVTGEMRRTAKMVNFGIIYGISPFGLSQRLGIRQKDAAGLIDQYFAKYPDIKNYMATTIQFARDNGYVETIMGRRRYLRDINSANATVRSAVERTAINAPIQGSAADMIKVAMIRIHDTIIANGYATKMLMQVHDELVFDLYREERETVIPMIKSAMENAIPMQVPIVVEVGLGKNWLEAH